MPNESETEPDGTEVVNRSEDEEVARLEACLMKMEKEELAKLYRMNMKMGEKENGNGRSERGSWKENWE